MENFEKEINARGLRLKSEFLAPKIDAITTLSVSANEIFDSILSRDLRAVATSKLATLNVSSMRECSEPVLFQVISVVNIAQPCTKQMIPGLQPALLQLKLTDGQNKYVTIALEDIPKLSVSTAPGTKVLVKCCLIRKGKFLLSKENTQVIGGHVRELVEQWKTQKELRERKRACAADQEDPPPVFTDFEPTQKISQNHNGESSTPTKACKPEASRPNASKHSRKKSTLSSKKPPMIKKKEKSDASKQSKSKTFKPKDAESKIAKSQTKPAKKEEKKRINPNKPKRFPRGPKKTDSPAL
uniref:RecQ-mediated genome instability protein 1 n=1 Tax=Albugo laibachii Nc14 TaxID=890382 RepID=F0X1K4_9STRA|nr:PREDICTED: similar to tudor domain containing 3 put [Albugo laibachii Nc14]|eukprot:CCA27696.1 PREDICTED: similar to tudor domain containing 3 put [Albugo laibachii Nc14]